MLGQYEVFSHLHEQFPDLVLEQCGYGSRLDLGLAGTIRANWLSDASFPSTHVRQNSLVASYVYPSSYNGAWVLRDKELETTDAIPPCRHDLSQSHDGLVRIRDTAWNSSRTCIAVPSGGAGSLHGGTSSFKRYRHLLNGDTYHLFPPSGSAEGWQAVQFSAGDARQTVVLCFRNGSRQALMRLPVKGVIPALSYKGTSANNTEFRPQNGTTLLREGRR